MARDLLTYGEYLARAGKAAADVDQTEAARIQAAISDASQAVRQYVDRDLTLNIDSVQGDRTFRWLGHNTIDIDDATTINSISLASTPWSPFSRTLDVSEWVQPLPEPNLPVIDYVELWTNLPFGSSPEMGFKWNQDRYGWRPHPIELTVNAVWGWPLIPGDVKMAVVWTTAEMLADLSPYTAEAIEGYSHSYGSGRTVNTLPQEVVPQRAQSILAAYQRVNV